MLNVMTTFVIRQCCLHIPVAPIQNVCKILCYRTFLSQHCAVCAIVRTHGRFYTYWTWLSHEMVKYLAYCCNIGKIKTGIYVICLDKWNSRRATYQLVNKKKILSIYSGIYCKKKLRKMTPEMDQSWNSK